MQANHSSVITHPQNKETYYNYIMLTLPRSLIGSMADIQAGSKLLTQGSRKTLGEDVGVL
jgi:hypothetical protein